MPPCVEMGCESVSIQTAWRAGRTVKSIVESDSLTDAYDMRVCHASRLPVGS